MTSVSTKHFHQCYQLSSLAQCPHILLLLPQKKTKAVPCRDPSHCCAAVTREGLPASLLLLQLSKGGLNTALLLHSRIANCSPMPLCEEIFHEKWLILERESYTSRAAHSGSHLQEQHIASELTFHVTQDGQDAGWMPSQAAETRHNAHSSRQEKKNKNPPKQKSLCSVIFLI